jgi:hypothetical protein
VKLIERECTVQAHAGDRSLGGPLLALRPYATARHDIGHDPGRGVKEVHPRLARWMELRVCPTDSSGQADSSVGAIGMAAVDDGLDSSRHVLQPDAVLGDRDP